MRPRFAVLYLLWMLSLIACTAPQATALSSATAPTLSATALPTLISTAAPTLTPPPSPTPVPTFAAGSTIGGVDVAGLTLAVAEQRVSAALADLVRPLELRVGEERLTLEPEAIELQLPIAAMLEQAASALAADTAVDLPLEASFDPASLRVAIEDLAAQVAVPAELSVLSATDELSRTFAYTPGLTLDVDRAVKAVAGRLADLKAKGPLTLKLAEDPTTPQVSKERLQAEIEALAATWKGVTGLYLYDLQNGEELEYNAKSVFAGASTIKVAIMLNAYANLPKFTSRQEFWMGEMIRYSDNLSANDLLSAAAGGTGTDYAFSGANEMSALLAELGLKNTYLYVPYESGDYIAANKVKYKCGPKDPVGPKPYTETGCALRTTPYEMAQVYRQIDACAKGEGTLSADYKLLTTKRCQEMLNRLATNADKKRFVFGLPKGTRVEHKSGWIENMQADVGIIRSPGGDFVLAVYLYRKLPKGVYLWDDAYVAPYLGAFAGLAYSAYNPLKITDCKLQIADCQPERSAAP